MNTILLDTAAEPPASMVTWAALNLADIPVVVNADVFIDRAENITDDAGRWRWAGQINVDLRKHRRFEIDLAPDASPRDLEFFNGLVEEARRGRFGEQYGFHETADGRWCLNVHRRRTDADDLEGRRIVECTEAACLDRYHVALEETGWFSHVALRTDHDDWQVEVYRNVDELTWMVNLYADDCYVTSGNAAGIASDIHWAIAECDKLNGARQRA